MVVKEIQTVTEEEFIRYIDEAAQAASYQQGFGTTGCDLSMPVWWAGYCRQSLDQQSHNNRLPEYLLTLARMAKDYGVVIPREYVFYDHVSGEHLDRPAMRFLRHELVDKKKVLGIFFIRPALSFQGTGTPAGVRAGMRDTGHQAGVRRCPQRYGYRQPVCPLRHHLQQ